MDKRTKGWLQAVLVLVVAAIAFALSEWVASLAESPDSHQAADERVIGVTAQRIDPTTHRLRFATTGTVQVKSYVELIPQVSGRVVGVDSAVYPGEHFDAGTVLFRIDPRDYEANAANRRAAVAQSRRALEQRQAEAETATREWQRLHPGTEPPPLVARLPQLEEARASLDAAESALVKARRDLERTRFALPFDGRVVESTLEEGQFVTAGRSFGRVYRDDALEVRAPVNAREQQWLVDAENPAVTLHVVRDDRRVGYDGSLARMGAEAALETRLRDAIFRFVEPPASVTPGEFVEIEVIGPKVEGVWVLPVRALQEDGNIWVVDDSNRLRSLTPKIHNIAGERVVAKSNGESITVVTEALRTATDGMKVEVQYVQ